MVEVAKLCELHLEPMFDLQNMVQRCKAESMFRLLQGSNLQLAGSGCVSSSAERVLDVSVIL